MTTERQNEIWAMLPEYFKEQLGYDYAQANVALAQDPTNVRIDTHKRFLEKYFGTYNLTAKVEEKPKEPKFRVGDKVKVMVSAEPYQYGSIHTIIELHAYAKQSEYLLEKSNTMWFDESSLDPYTEPKEEEKREERGKSENFPIDYAQYRLDLAKEIAVAMINTPSGYGNIAMTAVDTANEIVKRLKETEE